MFLFDGALEIAPPRRRFDHLPFNGREAMIGANITAPTWCQA